MKVLKNLLIKYQEEVISAYMFVWDNDAQSGDINNIRAFFDKCVDMEYPEFIAKVNAEYGVLLENYRQAQHTKILAAIKGILTFFLIMYIIGIVAAAVLYFL